MTPLIAGLLKPAAYPHPAPMPRLIETHISWVIIAGDFAYKLKKPVNLGFLDFGDPARRHFYCQEELRLNRRLAPDTYLGLTPVTGSAEAPRMGGAGPALEWAVRMRAFPPDATLDRAAAIDPAQIDAIADRVARFHLTIPAAPADTDYGSPARVLAPVAANFAQLRALLGDGDKEGSLIDGLEAWSLAEGARLEPHFAARRAEGFVRECHGDLHLGNVAWVDAAPLIFDALEFNPELRFIDVVNETAFMTMDLAHRGRDDLAWRFLNRYLEHTGDYAGLAALPHYQAYRALVRAKVAAIRARQAGAQLGECAAHLALAERLTRPRRPALILMHGVSGTGKTWLAQHLLEALGALRLRSDVERKRLFGLAPLEQSGAIPGGIYTPGAGHRTLARLLELARRLLSAGFSVIVDATFIRRDWRAPFQALAESMALPWRIVAIEAPAELLHARLAARQVLANDASEAGPELLPAQLAALEPFTDAELPHVLRLSGDSSPEAALNRLKAALP